MVLGRLSGRTQEGFRAQCGQRVLKRGQRGRSEEACMGRGESVWMVVYWHLFRRKDHLGLRFPLACPCSGNTLLSLWFLGYQTSPFPPVPGW